MTARYRLKQTAYIAKTPGGEAELLPEGTEIAFDGVPGPHMEPMNDEAEAAYAASGAAGKVLDPFARVPLNEPTGEERMAVLIAKAVSEGLAAALPAVAGSAPPPPPPPPPPPDLKAARRATA